MSNKQQRHYIHGDQDETNGTLFYCRRCDAFMDENHFFGEEEKCCNHWEKYDNDIKMLGKSPKKHRDFGRDINAINVFTLQKEYPPKGW